jgi:hypothetical protein
MVNARAQNASVLLCDDQLGFPSKVDQAKSFADRKAMSTKKNNNNLLNDLKHTRSCARAANAVNARES